ncbi:DAK2 domain-containing protein [Corynebacterium sanguinis]|uniref:DAK2 domain-containing protein n=1 Tax=Corynebacterium sanguinis TaxID=2594913 RepID=UPI0010AB1F91|nr:DAK2 domain-containing protein [Corynebacterium sanguinis]MCT1412110.1 DAK2 domain-containing protein [Corynebacterium sanguinis]
MANPPALEPMFDGAHLLSWAQRSASELDRRRMEINQLNVFPVPDADTGSNMAHTMAEAVREAAKLDESASMTEVAEALAVGSMRGARGNSGVVLSQVIRGVAQSVGRGEVTGDVVAQALSSGVDFVDRAIADPVEGTVVTVLRAAADAAHDAQGQPLDTVVEAAAVAAREALERTPSQLAALRDAGVVDAGGTGLVILLDELLAEVTGEEAREAPVPVAEEGHGAPAYLEIMFMFSGPVDELERTLVDAGGDSLLIARASDTEAKVHVHSVNAGALIEASFALGEVSDLRLEVLPEIENPAPTDRLIVAITPPGSLAQLYSEAGATTIAPEGDEAATVEAALAAVAEARPREVIFLPNGLMSDVGVASVKAASETVEHFTALPTVRLVTGIAALAVHDAALDMDVAAETMAEAAEEMRTAVVEHASGAPEDAVAEACAHLLEGGGELISVLYDPVEIPSLDHDLLSTTLGAEVRIYPADSLGAIAEIGVE